MLARVHYFKAQRAEVGDVNIVQFGKLYDLIKIFARVSISTVSYTHLTLPTTPYV